VSKFVNSFSFDHRLALKLSEVSYAELSVVRAYVPEGFQGNAFEYAKILQMSLDHTDRLVSNILLPFNEIISSFITNTNAQQSTVNKAQYLIQTDSQRNKLNTLIGKFFTASAMTSDKLGKFYQQNQEVAYVNEEISKLSKALEESNISLVQKTISHSLELINALQSSNQFGDMKKMSPQSVKAIGEATLSVAREVEFYGITRYRSEVFIKCFNDTLDSIKKAKLL
jgi:3-methyladenine DNA glycosylase Tag